jgi:hypothetical protein
VAGHRKHLRAAVVRLADLMNQSAPLRMMCGTEASVSVLLIVDGLP